jgi:hypothetical protein
VRDKERERKREREREREINKRDCGKKSKRMR